jgi:hypothetical protein
MKLLNTAQVHSLLAYLGNKVSKFVFFLLTKTLIIMFVNDNLYVYYLPRLLAQYYLIILMTNWGSILQHISSLVLPM